jgi:hypothetical protein
MTISCEFREEFWNLKHGIWVRRQCRVIHLSHYALRVPRDYANEELHEKKHFVWCTSFLIYMKQLALLGCHVELYKWHRIESSYIVWRVVVWYSEPLRFFLLEGSGNGWSHVFNCGLDRHQETSSRQRSRFRASIKGVS